MHMAPSTMAYIVKIDAQADCMLAEKPSDITVLDLGRDVDRGVDSKIPQYMLNDDSVKQAFDGLDHLSRKFISKSVNQYINKP